VRDGDDEFHRKRIFCHVCGKSAGALLAMTTRYIAFVWLMRGGWRPAEAGLESELKLSQHLRAGLLSVVAARLAAWALRDWWRGRAALLSVSGAVVRSVSLPW
jgi:hypothetical protein